VHVTDDWYVYEMIEGRPFRRGDDVDGAMIDELHTVPIDVAAGVLQRPAVHAAEHGTRAKRADLAPQAPHGG
jgi:hypothetical protein